jgi:DNA-binding NarL/FixJ family response regulator
LHHDELNEREVEVLRELAAGKTNIEIGDGLCIAIGTVKSHISSVVVKLGAANRTQAAVLGVHHGYVRLD